LSSGVIASSAAHLRLRKASSRFDLASNSSIAALLVICEAATVSSVEILAPAMVSRLVLREITYPTMPTVAVLTTPTTAAPAAIHADSTMGSMLQCYG